ncbi:MAG TPA: hypothetical protein VFI96_01905 [Longimicrobiaceae bacterium]|nr:hypothetical protein [Longimicrobiaceae bacterium]
MTWSPEELDRLERAIVDGDRVRLVRRGTEFVVVPREIRPEGGGDVLFATTTQGERTFALDEIEEFEVLR